MFLSLLYDRILIQDDALALSSKLSDWFLTTEDQRLLEKLFDVGTLRVLKLPPDAYPPNMTDLATKSPIQARAKYIETIGTKEELHFCPSPKQKHFYETIDWYLHEHESALYVSDAPLKLNVLAEFADTLKHVLSGDNYIAWIRSAFKGVTRTMANDFVACIDDPSIAVHKLKNAGKPIERIRYGQNGRAIFNRSLAYQLADLYKPNHKVMQRLIQTTFAAPFCASLESVGRYSDALRELVWLPKFAENITQMDEQPVSVEVSVSIPLDLPQFDSDFPQVIQKVRDTPEGKELRKAVRQVGKEPEFRRQEECWKSVAERLAAMCEKGQLISVAATLLKIGTEFAGGLVVGTAAQTLLSHPVSIPENLLAGLFATFAPVGDHIIRLVCNGFKHQRLREQLERAVSFRCTDVGWPPVVHAQ